MASKNEQIFVKSHVARDLIQNAALFKTDRLVVWEYVSNGLQYTSPGTNPIVRVILDSKKKKIAIIDNGRGMDWEGLQNFFIMHGENLDRKEGRPGRGRFGTGKSAAFGIADILRITSYRSGKKSIIELDRNEVSKTNSENPIPVRTIEKETQTINQNGTIIEIENIHLRSLDQAGIIHYIERHLARWPKNASVMVNNHECEFSEPPIHSIYRYKPEGNFAVSLGDVELVIKVSKTSLEQDLRGISIFANNVWHETTLAGSENKDMAQYIFGEIDVPKLDEDNSPISPFDLSRSMRLNPENETVRLVYSFINQRVEEIRKKLVEADKNRKTDEENKKLEKEAAEIAKVINEDFDQFKQKIAKARAKVLGGSDEYEGEKNNSQYEEDDLIFGHEKKAEIIEPHGGIGHGDGKSKEGNAPPQNAPQVGAFNPDAKKNAKSAGKNRSTRPKGGFNVEFQSMGIEYLYRAKYVSDERTIYINLDHPQLSAAKGRRPIEDPIFKRLSYEIAFSEYSIALASELDKRGEYIDTSDPIVDIRETLNRVARKAAPLYKEVEND